MLILVSSLALIKKLKWLQRFRHLHTDSHFKPVVRVFVKSAHFFSFLEQVTGVVADSTGQAHYILSGTWDDKIESAKIVQSSRGGSGSEGKQKTVYQTLSPKLLWKKYPLP